MNILECQNPGCWYRGYASFFADGACPICRRHDIKNVGAVDEHFGERESEKKDGHFRSDVERERR